MRISKRPLPPSLRSGTLSRKRARRKKESVRLGQPLLRDGDAHLALFRLHEIGEREHGAVGRTAQKADDHEEADQTRHVRNSKCPQSAESALWPQTEAETLTNTFRPNWQGLRGRGIRLAHKHR